MMGGDSSHMRTSIVTTPAVYVVNSLEKVGGMGLLLLGIHQPQRAPYTAETSTV